MPKHSVSQDNRKIEVYQDGAVTLEVLADRSAKEVWLTRKQIAELLDLTVQAIGLHINNYKEIYPDAESVCKKFLITASDGKQYEVEHYSMDAVLYIAYRAQSTERIWKFREWVSGIVTRYLTGDLRATEKHTYEGVKDLIAGSVDYDPDSDLCRQYFATVQNKLLYAVTGCTAADLRATRANHQRPNMGVQSFAGDHVILSDALVGKNYLTPAELEELMGLVSVLHTVARRYQKTRATMQEWVRYVDDQIVLARYEKLMGLGRHSKDAADAIVRREYDAFKRTLKSGK